MTIFNPTEYPPDNLTLINGDAGVELNTSLNNSATNNNVPLLKYILVFE